MTTIFTDDGPGPRTHALVLGVGHYPHCAQPERFDPREAALARAFGDMTSPPASAARFAEWLMTEQVGNAVAPLGSVELLASGPSGAPVHVNTPTVSTAVDAPRFDAVEDAFQRWFTRCDSHQDNVAMFFFSGHGCQQHDQLVLLEDVGKNPLAFFANTIKISELVGAMARCRAQAQCFFVDACRTVPTDVLTMSDIRTKPLLQPDIHVTWRDQPVIFATSPGTTAHGTPGGVTLFTETLIAALDGGAANARRDGRWEINVRRIPSAINELLEWNDVHEQFSSGSSLRSMVIRELPGSPPVRFRFGCEPRQALRFANLSLVDLTTNARVDRGPQPALWEGELPPAEFSQLHATFSDGRFTSATRHVRIYPPCTEEDVDVSGGGVTRADR